MRLIGLLCVRNEADRYLERVLQWHASFLDELFVVDDRSTDNSYAIAARWAHVVERPLSAPTFLENESRFRENAWLACGWALDLTPADWVFALDADEFFSSNVEDERSTLERMTRDAGDRPSVTMRVDEIFDVVGEVAMRRVDGYWNDIRATRLARFVPTLSSFMDRRMGGGSVPSYAYISTHDATKAPASILHYGYTQAADRQAKYERYTTHTDSGHNRRHIESILTTPRLEEAGPSIIGFE